MPSRQTITGIVIFFLNVSAAVAIKEPPARWSMRAGSLRSEGRHVHGSPSPTDFGISLDDVNVLEIMNEEMPDSTAGHHSLRLFFGLGFAYLLLSAFTGLMSDSAYLACHCFLVAFTIAYVLYSGLFWAWKGQDRMAWSRRFISVVFALQIFYCLSFASCVFMDLSTATDWIVNRLMQNEWAHMLREEYQDEKGRLSGPRRDYFESELFRQKCSDLFDELDRRKTGHLDSAALRPLLVREFGRTYSSECNAFAEVFGDSGDSFVQRDAFRHVVQYISLKKSKAAARQGLLTEDAAWEVLQLDSREATSGDVLSAFEELASKYDPAKRTDVPECERGRDIQEIIDAKNVLDEKLEIGETNSCDLNC